MATGVTQAATKMVDPVAETLDTRAAKQAGHRLGQLEPILLHPNRVERGHKPTDGFLAI
jgi:hypothetical protein